MIVKYKSSQSNPKDLIGGSSQGTILGGINHNIASSDCGTEVITSEDRFRYYDDMYILELIILCEKLQEYDVRNHIPSDVAIDHLFLNPKKFRMQSYLDEVTKWTHENLMLLNEEKSNYILFTRSKSDFTTRLLLNQAPIKRLSVVKILGVWIQEDMGWEENTKQICKKSDSRISILNRLKYAGICIEDLITIYILFIRSLTEYCSVAFHASLTQKQSQKL